MVPALLVYERHMTNCMQDQVATLQMLSALQGAPPSGCHPETLCNSTTCQGMLLGRSASQIFPLRLMPALTYSL